MVPRVGLEPTTLGLEVLCSIQLSYQGMTPVIFIIPEIPAIELGGRIFGEPQFVLIQRGHRLTVVNITIFDHLVYFLRRKESEFGNAFGAIRCFVVG